MKYSSTVATVHCAQKDIYLIYLLFSAYRFYQSFLSNAGRSQPFSFATFFVYADCFVHQEIGSVTFFIRFMIDIFFFKRRHSCKFGLAIFFFFFTILSQEGHDICLSGEDLGRG